MEEATEKAKETLGPRGGDADGHVKRKGGGASELGDDPEAKRPEHSVKRKRWRPRVRFRQRTTGPSDSDRVWEVRLIVPVTDYFFASQLQIHPCWLLWKPGSGPSGPRVLAAGTTERPEMLQVEGTCALTLGPHSPAVGGARLPGGQRPRTRSWCTSAPARGVWWPAPRRGSTFLWDLLQQLCGECPVPAPETLPGISEGSSSAPRGDEPLL